MVTCQLRSGASSRRPAVRTKGLIDNETTASPLDTGLREAAKSYIYIGTEKCIKIDHQHGVFPLLGAG